APRIQEDAQRIVEIAAGASTKTLKCRTLSPRHQYAEEKRLRGVEIKSDAALMHIPVIMLTTSDREADIVKSYAKGAAPISRNRWTLPNSETWSSDLLFIGYWWLRFRRGRG